MENYEKKTDLAKRRDTDMMHSDYEDRQMRENLSLLERLTAIVTGKNVPQRRHHGWLMFWTCLFVMVLALIGGVYWFNQHSDAEQEQTPEVSAAITDVDTAIELDIAAGLGKYVARYKQKELAKARNDAAEAYTAFMASKVSCAEILKTYNVSEVSSGSLSAYERCREIIIDRLKDYQANAEQVSVSNTLYQQQISHFDKEISLLDAANLRYEEWRDAADYLTQLQQKNASDWTSEYWRSWAIIAGVLTIVFFIALVTYTCMDKFEQCIICFILDVICLICFCIFATLK